MSTIWQRRHALDKERRDAVRVAMAEYDKLHNEKRRMLIAECGQEGHLDHFTHIGPLGSPWFTCNKCGRSRVESDEDSA